MGSVGEMSTVSSQIIVKCMYLARIGRPDILWSVNKLARAVTKWTRACDKRSARLISYIHVNSNNIVMQEMQHHNADKDCFRTLILQGYLEDLKINIRWNFVHFRKSHVLASKLDVQETDFNFTQFN